MGNQHKQFHERRSSKDIWAKTMAFFNLLAWVMIAFILIVTERAKPQFESFFDRAYQLKLRTYWDMAFVDYLLYLTIIGLIISTSGLCLSLVRARRESDKIPVALLIMGSVSIAGIVGIFFFR